MGRIISFVNNKGGVGKTTSVVNLGHALATCNQKVLLVDLDSQCNATGVFQRDEEHKSTLYELYDLGQSADVGECIYDTPYKNLWILPNVQETVTLEATLNSAPMNGYSVLRDRLCAYAKANFDYVLLDCPPNLGMFAVQGLVASDYVVVPIECGSRFALDGLERTMNTISGVQEHFQANIKAIRLLVSRVDKRTSISRVITQQLRKQFGDKVFDTVIPINTTVQQAELLRQTVIDYSPESNAAHSFQVLARELLRTWA